MIQSLGRRLALIFDRTGPAEADDPAAPAHPGAAVLYPLVEFFAYADDCILSGRIRLRSERLTDMLNDHEELLLVDVMVQSLLEGEAVEVNEVLVPRDELLMVHATGPRGDQARRTRTRQQFVAIDAGPYAIRGYLHGVPGPDPVAGIHRRNVMVPLTDAWVDFSLGGQRLRQWLGTVIVNRDGIDHIGPSLEHDVEVPDLPISAGSGPRFDDLATNLLIGPTIA